MRCDALGDTARLDEFDVYGLIERIRAVDRRSLGCGDSSDLSLLLTFLDILFRHQVIGHNDATHAQLVDPRRRVGKQPNLARATGAALHATIGKLIDDVDRSITFRCEFSALDKQLIARHDVGVRARDEGVM